MFSFVNTNLAMSIVAYSMAATIVIFMFGMKMLSRLASGTISFKRYFVSTMSFSWALSLPWLWFLYQDWKTTLVMSVCLAPFYYVFAALNKKQFTAVLENIFKEFAN